uniref:Uncharacterized protein n=1 Tax=Oryzias latipes TaxID=8090 RepID=A0A3B3IEB3_ORYLA
LSKTLITIPDFGGDPPSTAVRISLCSACFSLSRGFCNTRKGILSSSPSRTLTLKYSF